MERSVLPRLSATVAGSLMLGLALPAVAFAAPDAQPNPDPWEHFNRRVFAFNEAIDRAILRPIAMTYKRVLPAPLRDGIHNIISNLTEPVVASNDLLQGRFRQAGLSTARLLTNTTIGIGGLFDVASKIGAPHHYNGFDITMGRYHIKPGPYLFIPLLGPASVRDVVGFGVDGLLDPLHWTRYPYQTTINILRPVVGGIDTRARVDEQFQSLMSEATDPYATLRSVYMQNEESQIHAGQPTSEQPLPDFGDPTPAAPETGAAPSDHPAAPAAQTPAADTPVPVTPAPAAPVPTTPVPSAPVPARSAPAASSTPPA